jgi:hypothetical protein
MDDILSHRRDSTKRILLSGRNIPGIAARRLREEAARLAAIGGIKRAWHVSSIEELLVPDH